ncbi:peptidoglycan-associated lipoprotein Pal [bacterium]|nr:peptidoglycan-associated lipoprotein Pal [bacterium]
MRKNITWILLVLCCGAFAVAGCAKKETVKKDETPAPPAAATTETAQPAPVPAPVPVAQEPVVKEEVVKSTGEALQPFETIYFDLDSYVLRQDARDILAKNAQWMLKNPAEKVRLEGNCDERGSDEYNLALGEKRAKAALSYLLTLGVNQASVSTISYGKEKPVDPGHDEAAWAKNRRVDFVIVK